MVRKSEILTGAARRNALCRLSAQERRKYELAEELGLLEKVKEVGWAGLSAKETGRIGGKMGKRGKGEKKRDS